MPKKQKNLSLTCIINQADNFNESWTAKRPDIVKKNSDTYKMAARVTPELSLNLLSQLEVGKLRSTSEGGLYKLFRQCSLAVLNSGNSPDIGKLLLERYKSFDIHVIQQARGIKLEVNNAPASAFVEGKMIKGIKEHLFSVLRDVIYASNEIYSASTFDLTRSNGITNAVFHILRNAKIVKPQPNPNIVVCWGGHSISGEEYHYTKSVGHILGLYGLNICTGCGPGAMKGPMKGATIGHAKQRLTKMRYIGISEPGIIAAESPNPIVNELVIMPDMEKRLEAFVRVGHAYLVFPGGAGTAEELLYLLGILLHPDNAEIPFPLVLTGPLKSRGYFRAIDHFVKAVLGDEACRKYKIIIDNPAAVAEYCKQQIGVVKSYRKKTQDAFFFNWKINIQKEFQLPFKPSHANMKQLELKEDMERHELAANLRKIFSGIVSGNLKDEGISSIEKHGPFKIRGDQKIMDLLDTLLKTFVAQKRMKISGEEYNPCYEVIGHGA